MSTLYAEWFRQHPLSSEAQELRSQYGHSNGTRHLRWDDQPCLIEQKFNLKLALRACVDLKNLASNWPCGLVSTSEILRGQTNTRKYMSGPLNSHSEL